MLRRPPTRIELTVEDVQEYAQERKQRQQQLQRDRGEEDVMMHTPEPTIRTAVRARIGITGGRGKN
eukprot:m.289348 g.289348  ORF g.289348 m.289348 type:complete len:66 (+) comp12117_c0_seq1:3-200(+)